MNAKLVDSVVSIIDALDNEDYVLLQERLKNKLIQKTEGVCHGYARIRQTRVPVWTIISFLKQGANSDEILENYPMLTWLDITAAQSYYKDHQTEIDQIIAA
ncbi:hypothetical protein AWQ21_15085 (plasmid) [Picosynechococcus sp. PCC 7003]|uniref:DUF433 domain-containing protein n=1 Tax=Picosynechococcus sp. PCC 7003 TaxID=374981 RepID=UPI000810B338|nr:DUF433 domain-containing protein [Picosynechococcus sp. PCC 7003]ANV85854.1 hypothetical protein AWQ21_15085 [Picosynechococcus sp. PCC 7003]